MSNNFKWQNFSVEKFNETSEFSEAFRFKKKKKKTGKINLAIELI